MSYATVKITFFLVIGSFEYIVLKNFWKDTTKSLMGISVKSVLISY